MTAVPLKVVHSLGKYQHLYSPIPRSPIDRLGRSAYQAFFIIPDGVLVLRNGPSVSPESVLVLLFFVSNRVFVYLCRDSPSLRPGIARSFFKETALVTYATEPKS